jgi:hypothetical protein
MAKTVVTTITITVPSVSEEDFAAVNIEEYKEEIYQFIKDESDEEAIITIDVEIS